MSKKLKLYILDEVNVVFEGLQERHINRIIEKTEIFNPQARHTVAYKMGHDTGKESNFFENGRTFFYMLDKVLPMIEKFGYEITDIEDYRRETPEVDLITADYPAFTGKYNELYYYQLEAVNGTIKNQRGIVEVATSGGKSIIAATLAHVYNSHLDFITIVPSEKLVNQIHETFTEFGLDCGKITKGMTPKRKAAAWEHKHMVCTWQMLNNNRDKLERFGGFIYDEAHVMGDVMFEILADQLSHAVIRIGMTGTLPTDKLKREKVLCRIGADQILTVEPKELQDGGYIATCDIEMYPFIHEMKDLQVENLPDEKWEWYMEEEYLLNNPKRIEKLCEFLDHYKNSNSTTTIFTYKKLAAKLAKCLELPYIDGDTPEKEREVYYKELETVKGSTVIATYDTVGTGTSIDQIETVVLIDVGKNLTRILQTIGRGLRKDGVTNHAKIIDIFSKILVYNRATGKWRDISFSGKKHLQDRKKIYKKVEYPFVIKDETKV